MEINSLTVNDLTRKNSRKCEGRKGIQKHEPGQNIPSTVKLLGVLQLGFFVVKSETFVTLRT